MIFDQIKVAKHIWEPCCHLAAEKGRCFPLIVECFTGMKHEQNWYLNFEKCFITPKTKCFQSLPPSTSPTTRSSATATCSGSSTSRTGKTPEVERDTWCSNIRLWQTWNRYLSSMAWLDLTRIYIAEVREYRCIYIGEGFGQHSIAHYMSRQLLVMQHHRQLAKFIASCL